MKFSIALMFFGLITLADTYEYKIENMTCSGCKKMVKESICTLPGIKTCTVEIGSMMLTADDGKVLDQTAITKALEELNKKNRENYKIATFTKVDVKPAGTAPAANDVKPAVAPSTKETNKVKK